LRDDVEDIRKKIVKRFDFIDSARERAKTLSNTVLRLSFHSVSSIHRRDLKSAESYLSECSEYIKRLLEIYKIAPSVMGIAKDAFKEYSEAMCLFYIVKKNSFPDPEKLGVPYSSFIGGLAECVGELRRQFLEELKDGTLERAEDYFGIMEEIYELLLSINYCSTITDNIRVKRDYVRRLLERSHAELTRATLEDKVIQNLKRGG